MLEKTILLGLKADQFRHSLDLEATLALKQLPGLDQIIRNVLAPIGEQFFYLQNIAGSILVGENQLPDLYKLLVEACQILDIEVPQLYIKQNPVPNAYTFAMRGKQPFIVIHTSLIDLLTKEEIQAVMAHELGHLKCEHGVYLTLANIIVLASGGILPPWAGVVTQTLREKMLEWLRCAEFTCDRAALLATQNSRVVSSVLMKLTGGSPTLATQLNLDAFLAQARAYDDISKNQLGEMLKSLQTVQLTHPVPVLRAREINVYAHSKEYQNLLQKSSNVCYDGKAEIKGGWRNW